MLSTVVRQAEQTCDVVSFTTGRLLPADTSSTAKDKIPATDTRNIEGISITTNQIYSIVKLSFTRVIILRRQKQIFQILDTLEQLSFHWYQNSALVGKLQVIHNVINSAEANSSWHTIV
jgi:hypothetical protein